MELSIHRKVNSPLQAYKNQKNGCKARGVLFDISFDDWWNIWEEKFHLRGSYSDNLCMCRKNDVGGYSKDNVYLDTKSNNSRDNYVFMLAGLKDRHSTSRVLWVTISKHDLDKINNDLKMTSSYSISQVLKNHSAVDIVEDVCGLNLKVEFGTSIQIRLNPELKDKARKIGNGVMSRGIRYAVSQYIRQAIEAALKKDKLKENKK